jgi:signal transduction histidine kinase
VQDFHAEPDLAADLLRRLTSGQAVQSHRARIRRKNGAILHVLIDANGLWEDGRLIYSRWFVRDITRQAELEREILSVAEQERQRLGQDLHDDLCQQLTGIEFLSQTLAGQLASSSGRQVARAREIARMIRQAIKHTRELAHGLSPTELESEGLTGALHQLAERTHSMFHIDCLFRCKFPVAFKDPGLAVHLFRIAQEAVTNAIKHGKARRVTIQLTRSERGLALAIRDNGHGLPTTLEKSRGMGLRVMQYRAGVINGTLALHRNASGGATVKCVVSNSFIDYK